MGLVPKAVSGVGDVIGSVAMLRMSALPVASSDCYCDFLTRCGNYSARAVHVQSWRKNDAQQPLGASTVSREP